MKDAIDVAILGATGMVGQRYVQMLDRHPYFRVKCLTGMKSAGKKYAEGVEWHLSGDVPRYAQDIEVVTNEPRNVEADLVFSALPSEVARIDEPKFFRSGFPVVSEASAYRMLPNVPLLIPEVNPEHISILAAERRKHGSDSGFIVTTPNCTTVGIAMVLRPLQDAFSMRKVIVNTMQAISGAGFPGVPSLSILDNIIPFIEGEEEKVEVEVLKILSKVKDDGFTLERPQFTISATCNRVPVSDGHSESLYIELEKEIDLEEIKSMLRSFKGLPQKLHLPTAPTNPIIVREERDRPQPKLDRMAGSVPGMSVTVGRIRHGADKKSIRMSLLSHNTIRGAAGGAILVGELLWAKKMISTAGSLGKVTATTPSPIRIRR
jgi:aspartate-semialdehyde dehydrogenase